MPETAYASVGTACTVDVDLDGNNDTGEKGFCASTGNGAETVRPIVQPGAVLQRRCGYEFIVSHEPVGRVI